MSFQSILRAIVDPCGGAIGVAVMGSAKGNYTFLSHLKWSWAIALGYAASIAVHFWVNAAAFVQA